mmetsp:Transcript_25307/g.80058  ORF Transcript_25307/g.80058 Transcript_25307/m.80058 type:complete len:293 (+) Transcript_25307:173-1051(+)
MDQRDHDPSHGPPALRPFDVCRVDTSLARRQRNTARARALLAPQIFPRRPPRADRHGNMGNMGQGDPCVPCQFCSRSFMDQRSARQHCRDMHTLETPRTPSSQGELPVGRLGDGEEGEGGSGSRGAPLLLPTLSSGQGVAFEEGGHGSGTPPPSSWREDPAPAPSSATAEGAAPSPDGEAPSEEATGGAGPGSGAEDVGQEVRLVTSLPGGGIRRRRSGQGRQRATASSPPSARSNFAEEDRGSGAVLTWPFAGRVRVGGDGVGARGPRSGNRGHVCEVCNYSFNSAAALVS